MCGIAGYSLSQSSALDRTFEHGLGLFETLRTWLTERIYQHGRKFTMAELVERVTGGPLRIEPYVRYLRQKFGELYALDQ